MPRTALAARETGSISFSPMVASDGRSRFRARCRLCLPNLDTVDMATGSVAPGEVVSLEAVGDTEELAAVALKAAKERRLTSHARAHAEARGIRDSAGRPVPKVSRQTVAEAAKAAVAKQLASSEIGESSAYLYRLHIDKYLSGSDLGGMRLPDVSGEDVAVYLQAVMVQVARTGKSGVATARAGRAVLNATFAHARQRKVVTANPVRDAGSIKAPKATKSSRAKAAPRRVELSHDRALNSGERVQLAWAVSRDQRAIDLDVRDLILAGLVLGGRIGELCAVRWADVAFSDDGTAMVTLAATIDRVTGKGLVRRDPKTKASSRTVPVGRRTAALLKRRARQAGVDISPESLAENENPVFPAPGRWSLAGDSVAWRDRANTTKVIRDVFDRAGFAWLSMHGLRRSAVTRLADVLPIRQVADYAGHASIRTTLDHYIGRAEVSIRVAGLL